MSVKWNLWHGCDKKSEGCLHCYVYRIDEGYERDAREVKKTSAFNLPVRRARDGSYKIPPGELVYTCFTSDFLLDKADEWRADAWSMIRERSDLDFLFITKRIERFEKTAPPDWGNGYDNVIIGCTCENQRRADERLPIFLSLPIKHRFIITEPLLSGIKLERYLDKDKISEVTVGGESGNEARVCDYDWVLSLREQCKEAGVCFNFKQTGARFKKDGKIYIIPRRHQHSQAKKAGIDLNF